MRLMLAALILCLAGAGAYAQQTVCFHKIRHIQCHFPDGKLVTYDTDAMAEYYNIPPYMTFKTKDGVLHSIIGDCEISCKP